MARTNLTIKQLRGRNNPSLDALKDKLDEHDTTLDAADLAVPGTPTFSVGAEAANAIVTTVTLKDIQGATLAQAQVCDVWISDTAGAAPTGTVPDGAVSIGGSGIQLKEVTTKVLHRVKASASGTFTVSITESTAKSFYLNVAIGAKVASQQITFA